MNSRQFFAVCALPALLVDCEQASEVSIPTFPDGHTNIYPETYYVWQVETHGDFASVDDAAGVPPLFRQVAPEKVPRLGKVWADSKYHNYGLKEWMQKERPTWDLEVVSRPRGVKGFVLLRKRWVAERTLSWNDRCRRHSKDYEKRTDSSEAMVKVSAIGLMARRLAPAKCVAKFNYRHAA